MIFAIFIHPLLDILIELIQTKVQSKEAQYALEVSKVNAEIAKLGDTEEEPENIRAIGFQSNPILDEEEDDYDDDDNI